MPNEPMECQYHNNCGGWCETEEEREHCLCGDCMQAAQEDDEMVARHVEISKAMQRIAVAAGIELAKPGEVADIVCAKLGEVSELRAEQFPPPKTTPAFNK